VGVCGDRLLFEPPKCTSFLFNHFQSSKNPAAGRKGLVCGLHYLKAKGGSHESQDQREGRSPSSLSRRGRLKRTYQIKEDKEEAMKTKTNMKAGQRIGTR